jgi:hypothetical protein
MIYFDNLKKLSNVLVEESTGLLDLTKEFRQKLEDTKYELEQDFTDDEIDDQLGDVDFVNDFAEQLFEALNNLSTFCDHVMEDCKARKERLTHALIWDEIGAGGEELVQLSASEESTLMRHFYEDLGNECEAWYNMMSNKYASDVDLFLPNVEALGDQKYLMMNYASDEFHAIKDDMFTIVDGLRDAQRVIESTQNYFESRSLKAM